MKEILLGLLPGSMLIYRYARDMRVAALFGILLMEIAPFSVVAGLSEGTWVGVLLGFLSLYCVYEIGYLHNDLYASRRERSGVTERVQFRGFRAGIFLAVRIPVLAVVLWICFLYAPAWSGLSASFTLVAIALVFLLHNTVKFGGGRVGTFMALNALKIVYRLQFLTPGVAAYFPATMPHLAVKLIHYMRTKGLLHFDDRSFEKSKFGIYLGSFAFLALMAPPLLLVTLPYFANHCKFLVRKIARGER